MTGAFELAFVVDITAGDICVGESGVEVVALPAGKNHGLGKNANGWLTRDAPGLADFGYAAFDGSTGGNQRLAINHYRLRNASAEGISDAVAEGRQSSIKSHHQNRSGRHGRAGLCSQHRRKKHARNCQPLLHRKLLYPALHSTLDQLPGGYKRRTVHGEPEEIRGIPEWPNGRVPERK